MSFSAPVVFTIFVIRSSILLAPELLSFARNSIAGYEFVAGPSLGD